MKHSTKLSDAVHILAFVALQTGNDLTSDKIAESIHTNPSYVRQLMCALRNKGLLTSIKGHPRPALAKEPYQITLLDIYHGVEGDNPLLHQDIYTNPGCEVGVSIQSALRDCYDLVQEKCEEVMRSITLQEILERCRVKLEGAH